MYRISKEERDQVLKPYYDNCLDGEKALEDLCKRHPKEAEEEKNKHPPPKANETYWEYIAETSSVKRQVEVNSSEGSDSKKSRVESPEVNFSESSSKVNTSDSGYSQAGPSGEGSSRRNTEIEEAPQAETQVSVIESLKPSENETYFDKNFRLWKAVLEKYPEGKKWEYSRTGVCLLFEEWALEELATRKRSESATISIPRLLYLRKLSPDCRDLVEQIKVSIDKIKLIISNHAACMEIHSNGHGTSEIKYRGEHRSEALYKPESSGYSGQDIFRELAGYWPNVWTTLLWDFMALIRMSSFSFNELEITVGKVFGSLVMLGHRSDDFYICLRKHLKLQQREINVKKITFSVFPCQQEKFICETQQVCGVSAVLKAFNSKTLNVLKFRITSIKCTSIRKLRTERDEEYLWTKKDRFEFPSSITNLESWKTVSELDIEDNCISGKVIANTHFSLIAFGKFTDKQIVEEIIETIAAHPPRAKECCVTFTNEINHESLREAIVATCDDICSYDNDDILVKSVEKEKGSFRLKFTENGFNLTPLDQILQ